MLSLTLLGGFQARLGSGSAVGLPVRKTQALLAYLGVRPGHAHPRDKLAALLWGESSDERARDGLRHALAALRRALPATIPPMLLVEGQTLALSPAVSPTSLLEPERGRASPHSGLPCSRSAAGRRGGYAPRRSSSTRTEEPDGSSSRTASEHGRRMRGPPAR
jgi:hypothetical protein